MRSSENRVNAAWRLVSRVDPTAVPVARRERSPRQVKVQRGGRTMRTSRLATGAAVALAGALLAAGPATAAPAKPDVQCQRAGLKTLQSAGLLDDVARGGLPISTAVSLGVAPRAGTNL